MGKAAPLLGVSERQGWRLLAAYRKEGARGLVHKNRGRVPPNATPEAIQQRVVALTQERYLGINHTQLTELLAEREGLMLSRPTARRILVRAGLSSPRHRRPPQHRCRRQRMPQEGMLLQLDGSHHLWLEDRGPWLTLLLAVDDATGTAPHALFQEQEDTRGYLSLLQGIIERQGVPMAVYTDGHAVFQPRRNTSDLSQVPRKGPSTQWGRALGELGITQILAHSPEAKGRVERANGTFQDRLVSELRLADARTLEEANQVLADFLPRFNQRFGVPAAQPKAGLPASGPGVGPGWRAVYQGVAPSGQRQHGAIPRSHFATLSEYGAAQLRWSPGGGAGTSGWSSAGAASGADPDSPGSAASSRRTPGSGRRGSGGGGTSRPGPD